MNQSLKFLLPAAAVLILGGVTRVIPRLEAQAFSSPTHDVDNPARQAVFFSPVLPTQTKSLDPIFVNVFQVPPAKRLIITYIGYSGPAIGTFHSITVKAHPPNTSVPTSQAVAPFSAPVTGHVVASQQVFMFGNPGDQIDAALEVDSASDLNFNGAMIAGYLVNLP